jgi:hypothetical protein
MVEIDQPPRRRRGLETVSEPLGLGGIARDAVGLTRITVEHKEVHRSAPKRVIALIAGKRKIIQVRLRVGAVSIVVTEGWKKPVA